MATRTAAQKHVEPSGTLNRLPHLSAPLLRFNLRDEFRKLREEDSWQRETGRSSKTLAKYPDFRIVLVLMKVNTQMKEHHADGRISIHSIEGKLRVHLPDQQVELPAGELVVIDCGIKHDVEALEESAFLLTVSWPGGTKEERHKTR